MICNRFIGTKASNQAIAITFADVFLEPFMNNNDTVQLMFLQFIQRFTFGSFIYVDEWRSLDGFIQLHRQRCIFFYNNYKLDDRSFSLCIYNIENIQSHLY